MSIRGYTGLKKHRCNVAHLYSICNYISHYSGGCFLFFVKFYCVESSFDECPKLIVQDHYFLLEPDYVQFTYISTYKPLQVTIDTLRRTLGKCLLQFCIVVKLSYSGPVGPVAPLHAVARTKIVSLLLSNYSGFCSRRRWRLDGALQLAVVVAAAAAITADHGPGSGKQPVPPLPALRACSEPSTAAGPSHLCR